MRSEAREREKKGNAGDAVALDECGVWCKNAKGSVGEQIRDASFGTMRENKERQKKQKQKQDEAVSVSV